MRFWATCEGRLGRPATKTGSCVFPAKASAGTWAVRAECMAYAEHRDGSSRLRLDLQALKPGLDGKPVPDGLSATLLDLSELEAHRLAKLPIAERAALAATLLHEVQRVLWLHEHPSAKEANDP